MILRSGAVALEITLRERGPEGTPSAGDLGLNVHVGGGEFSGRNDTVWIGRDDWADFVAGLDALERTRQGKASVKAMNPEEFELEVLSVDRAGHMAAEGWVGRVRYGRMGTLRDRASFSIEIDPSTLPALVREIAGLSNFQPRSAADAGLFGRNVLTPSYHREPAYDSLRGGDPRYEFHCVGCDAVVTLDLSEYLTGDADGERILGESAVEAVRGRFDLNLVGKSHDGGWPRLRVERCRVCGRRYLAYV